MPNSSRVHLPNSRRYRCNGRVTESTFRDAADEHASVSVGDPPRGVWFHAREADRQESLESYHLLDTPREPLLDAVVRLAAAVCHSPAAFISLIDRDRQWFKAAHGLPPSMTETPRSASICSDAVALEHPLILEDTTRESRYLENPLVAGPPHIRSYAGIPLIGRDGLPLGTICVVDWRARSFSAEEISHLSTLSLEVANHFELHRRDFSTGRDPERLLRDALDPLRLRSAIEEGEFVPRYQPIVNMSTGQVVAIETLTRWQHPELGIVPASLFLPAMEHTGLMISLGRQVTTHALDTVRFMQEHFPGHTPPVTVNVSPEELRSKGLCDYLARSCEDAGVDPSVLMLEITESAPLPGDAAIRELERIRDLGIGVALDDFGSGVATLSQVVKLPITTLKIDRSLLVAASNEVRHQQVLANALELASSMGLHSCVEGVETEEQRTLLERLGARHGQGWLFTSALDAPQLVHFLEENGTSPEWAGDAVREGLQAL